MNVKYFIKYRLFLICHCINQKSRVLVLPYGLGDTYLICSLISEYQKRYSIDQLVLIVKPGHESIIKMFNLTLVTVVTRSMPELLRMTELYGQNKNGHMYIAHPNYTKESSLTSLIGYKDLNLADIYKVMFGLPPETNLQPPRLSKNVSEQAFHKLGLIKQKSVILFPEANSISIMNKKLWEDIAKYYKQLGYFVFCSTVNTVNQIPGTISIAIPISQIRDAATYAGYVVCLRSGICEVVSTSKAKIMIIYPDIKWYNGSLIEGSSIVKMKLNPNVTEIVVSKKMKISKELLKRFIYE